MWTTVDAHPIEKNIEILKCRHIKNNEEFLEAWRSDQSGINKHFELGPIYQPIKKLCTYVRPRIGSKGNTRKITIS